MAPCCAPVVPCVPQLGFGRLGIPGSVAAPLPLIDFVNFLRGARPSYHSRRLYVPQPPRRPRRVTFPEEVRAGPRGARIPGCSPWMVILWTIVREHSRGHRPGRGSRVCGWALCLVPCGSGSRERRVRWKDGSGRGAAPFAVAVGLRGSGKRGPRPGDVGGSRWAFVRARHHGLLRLAPSLRVSVARVGQVDVVPVGVSDGQVLLGFVARPCAVWLYKGSFWAGLARPGSSWFMAECAVVGVTSIGRPPGGRRRPRSCCVVSSLAHGRRGTGVARVLLCGAAAGPVAGCGSGSWGFLTRHTRALRRVLKCLCTRAVCAARAPVSVPMAGCRRSPSASARIWWIAVVDNNPAVIGLAVGSACMAGPFARPLVDPLRGRGGSSGMTGPGVALPPFPVAGGSRGSGRCSSLPGDVGGGRWGFIRVGHHGLLRLAYTSWVPVAGAG